MRNRFLLPRQKTLIEGNIYADRSAIVLSWLLKVGMYQEGFSLRETAKSCKVSVGLVQKVFDSLIFQGFLETRGVRTSKRFFMKKPAALLQSWTQQYSITKKCKMWSYRSGFQSREELLKALKKSDYHSQAVLALHSAAEAIGHKNTNLNTLELYIEGPDTREELEHALMLEPQEQGYEVLLIEPFYKGLLKLETGPHKKLRVSPPLLTFLDLYHFPLRGIEQAEFLAERTSELKQVISTG